MSVSLEEQKQAGSLTLNVGNLIGSMHDSQFQQGTTSSSQTHNKALDLGAVASVIGEIRSRLDETHLDAETAAQVNSDIACVEAQLPAPRPNISVIKESLRNTRSIYS